MGEVGIWLVLWDTVVGISWYLVLVFRLVHVVAALSSVAARSSKATY